MDICLCALTTADESLRVIAMIHACTYKTAHPRVARNLAETRLFSGVTEMDEMVCRYMVAVVYSTHLCAFFFILLLLPASGEVCFSK